MKGCILYIIYILYKIESFNNHLLSGFSSKMKKTKGRLKSFEKILQIGWIMDKIGLSKKDYIFGTLTAEEKKKRIIAFFLLPSAIIFILVLTSFFVSGSSDAEI